MGNGERSESKEKVCSRPEARMHASVLKRGKCETNGSLLPQPSRPGKASHDLLLKSFEEQKKGLIDPPMNFATD